MARDMTAGERQDSILDAAFGAFGSYGFRRTSMDDIARGAGLSRTALYMHFRSKEDIFRRLAERHFAGAEADMEIALSTPCDDLAAVLERVFAAKDGKFMAAVLDSPHGSELLDAGFSVSGDIATISEKRMVDLLGRWFERQLRNKSLGTPSEVATTLMAALRGLKISAGTMVEYRAAQSRLARIFALSINMDCEEPVALERSLK